MALVTDLAANFQEGQGVAASAAPDREGAGGNVEDGSGGVIVEKVRAGVNDGPQGAGLGGLGVHGSHPIEPALP